MRKTDIADLRAAVRDGQPRPVFLLGAGASATSGVPLVGGLIDLIGKHAYCREFDRDPADPTLDRDELASWLWKFEWFDLDLEPQELYARHIEHLLTPRERRRQFFQEHVVVNPDQASEGYRLLAALVGKGRIHSILTTNFDSLIIDSCRRDPAASLITHISSTAQVRFITTDPALCQVIHVHGLVEQYADLNLTDDLARLDADFAARIVPLIADHPLVVIGYRGAESTVYRDLLLAAADHGADALPHGIYWCTLNVSEDVHPRVVALAERCGNNFALVEIEGFDEVMAVLDQDSPEASTSELGDGASGSRDPERATCSTQRHPQSDCEPARSLSLDVQAPASRYQMRTDVDRSDDMAIEPLEIVRIVGSDITEPRNDGSPGSALYSVPFQLSRRPDTTEYDLLLKNWDNPPRLTTMHRFGCLRLSDDRIILDGTTIEEVERYHAETLELVVRQTNREASELRAMAQRRAERRAAASEEHRTHVSEIAERIEFRD